MKVRKATHGVATSSESLPNIEETAPTETPMVNPPEPNDQATTDPHPRSKPPLLSIGSNVIRARARSIGIRPHCNRCLSLPRSPSSTYGYPDVPVNAHSPCRPIAPDPFGAIPIPGGTHFRANVFYSGTTVAPDAHQTWGCPPYVHLDDLATSNAAPMYSLPNLVTTQAFNTIPSLPNLVYPTTTKPSLRVLYFPINVHTPDPQSPPTYHLRVQLVPKKFKIPNMPIFGPESNPTGHVINYNIHIDLRMTFEGLECHTFLVTFDEQGKMWFTSLTPSSIIGFKQHIDLFEGQFSNQHQCPITVTNSCALGRRRLNHSGTTLSASTGKP
ncbi:hypothetical protein ACLOJK_025338 [Asimina triloba]